MSSVEHVQLNRARLSATARASTARAKAKGSKDSKDSKDRTRARTRNNGLLEQEGPDQERWFKWKEHKRTLTILTLRNQQTVNQKLKSVNST